MTVWCRSHVEIKSAQERKCAKCQKISCMVMDAAKDLGMTDEVNDCTLIVPFERLR